MMIHRERRQIIILIYQRETIKLLRFSVVAFQKSQTDEEAEPSALGAGNKGDSLGGG